MIVGDLLQQLYNVVDTLIVGKFVGRDALAAVGSSYTLMTFLTSILLGLCMGSGTVFSMYYGAKNNERLKKSAYTSFIMIAVCAVILSVIVFRLCRSDNGLFAGTRRGISDDEKLSYDNLYRHRGHVFI